MYKVQINLAVCTKCKHRRCDMKTLNVIIWEATSADRVTPLRVSLIKSDGHYNHICELTHGGQRVCTAPEAEPLVGYAELEFGATKGKFAD